MKTSKKTLTQMQDNIKKFLDQTGITLPEIYGPYMHQIWFKVYVCIKYDSENANVIKLNGKRILPYDPNFELYPDNTNDTTLSTALKIIHKNLTK